MIIAQTFVGLLSGLIIDVAGNITVTITHAHQQNTSQPLCHRAQKRYIPRLTLFPPSAVSVCMSLLQIVFYLSGVMLVAANAGVFFLRLSKPPEGIEEEEEQGEEAEAKLEETARKQTQRITRCQSHPLHIARGWS